MSAGAPDEDIDTSAAFEGREIVQIRCHGCAGVVRVFFGDTVLSMGADSALEVSAAMAVAAIEAGAEPDGADQ